VSAPRRQAPPEPPWPRPQLSWSALRHGGGVDPKHDLRVEHREECLHITAPRGGDERIDDLSLAGEIGVGTLAEPRIRRRARLASCRAAAGVLPTIGAISSKGIANVSWRTKASRSAGESVSRTTISARPTESARTASCSGSLASGSTKAKPGVGRPATPPAVTCAT